LEKKVEAEPDGHPGLHPPHQCPADPQLRAQDRQAASRCRRHDGYHLCRSRADQFTMDAALPLTELAWRPHSSFCAAASRSPSLLSRGGHSRRHAGRQGAAVLQDWLLLIKGGEFWLVPVRHNPAPRRAGEGFGRAARMGLSGFNLPQVVWAGIEQCRPRAARVGLPPDRLRAVYAAPRRAGRRRNERSRS
jgi:hypothetical protein